MGFIKFDNKVVYEGPLAKVVFNDGWNDSMAEYYPSVYITYMGADGYYSNYVKVEEFLSPNQTKLFEFQLDPHQAHDYKAYVARKAAEEEAKVVKLHRVVKVVRGRKLKIGTEGEVFWIGNSGYGMSVGIRLLSGHKVFTALSNVEVLDMEKEVEKVLLGEET